MKVKKILFVTDSLICGGAERALVALLQALDYEKYEVDLLYFCQEQTYFKDQIPEQVHILHPETATQIALSSGSYVLKHLFDIRYWPLVFNRLWAALWGKLQPDKYYARRVKDWKRMRRFVPKLEGTYDAAIAFLETNSVYYTLDQTSASTYIVWQRTDYKTTGCDARLDGAYFQRANSICVLSEEMKENFLKVFPEFSQRIVVFPNLIDISAVIQKAKEPVEFDDSYQGLRIISVGTLRQVKGYDVAMRACRKMLDDGYSFRWYILGSGEEQERLQNEIHRLNIADHFILVGNCRNPYPYISRSDIFVQCSYREGFSTTVFEAKCLQKPIVITDAPGMRNQITNNVNGLIAPVGDNNAVAEAIESLLCAPEERKRFSNALQSNILEYQNNVEEKLNLFDTITSNMEENG